MRIGSHQGLLHASFRRKSRLIGGFQMAATVQLQTRQLEVGHVLFMDIVDYAQLPVSEQQILLQQLHGYIEATKELKEARTRDQVISLEFGEGIALVFFGDPEAALRC